MSSEPASPQTSIYLFLLDATNLISTVPDTKILFPHDTSRFQSLGSEPVLSQTAIYLFLPDTSNFFSTLQTDFQFPNPSGFLPHRHSFPSHGKVAFPPKQHSTTLTQYNTFSLSVTLQLPFPRCKFKSLSLQV